MDLINVLTPLPKARPSSDYAELKHLIKEAGLLEKQPVYFATKMLLLLVMLTLSVLFLLPLGKMICTR